MAMARSDLRTWGVGGRATILVVEDNDDVRDMMAVTLELEGHEVITARNGKEALDILRGGVVPCVILLDLMMPVMNGWEFRAALDADDELRHLPVVVISAAGREVLESAHAVAYLPKPIDIEKLLDVVCTLCSGQNGRAFSATAASRRG
jgi:CheY-like chemotaxis protein